MITAEIKNNSRCSITGTQNNKSHSSIGINNKNYRAKSGLTPGLEIIEMYQDAFPEDNAYYSYHSKKEETIRSLTVAYDKRIKDYSNELDSLLSARDNIQQL